jgi:hypothetical protein
VLSIVSSILFLSELDGDDDDDDDDDVFDDKICNKSINEHFVGDPQHGLSTKEDEDMVIISGLIWELFGCRRRCCTNLLNEGRRRNKELVPVHVIVIFLVSIKTRKKQQINKKSHTHTHTHSLSFFRAR